MFCYWACWEGRRPLPTIKQGNVYKRRVDYPDGHPLNPMTDAELESKFHDMASEYMTETQVRKIIDTVNRLEKLDDIGSLMQTAVFKEKDIRSAKPE